MTESREVVILANPYSGKGKNKLRVAALQAALAERDLSTRQVWDLGERAELLADPEVGSRYRCVVSAGGDGSIAGVVNDLQKGGDTTRAPIAMLPMGNENLFAKEFGHGKSVGTLAGAIHRLKTRTIDAGEADGRLFTLMASAGFDAQVVERVDHWRRQTDGGRLKRVNRLSYARPIIAALAGYRYPAITLTAEGQSVTGSHAFVFNIGRYGGGLRIGAHADPSDGLLDWVVFQKPGLIQLASYGLGAITGRHLKRGDVLHGRASEIKLRAQPDSDGNTPELPLQIDGDPGGVLPSTIRARPGAMRVVVVD